MKNFLTDSKSHQGHFRHVEPVVDFLLSSLINATTHDQHTGMQAII
ncbi:MAG: hypothetical protein JSV61_11415 [Anaerolineales bacterium]|nr:MAG: hypothetical protein JSV61_11415 [Anaerolineales bacterium]